jgi:hypothetical protein
MASATVPGADDQVEDVPTVDAGASDDTTGGSVPDGAAEPGDGDAAAADVTTDDDGDLLTPEEREAAGDDIAKLRKAYNRAFTQKSQKLAGANKFLAALEADPQGVARELVRRTGLRLAEEPAPAAVPDYRSSKLGEIREKLTKVVGAEMAGVEADARVQGVQQAVGARMMAEVKERADLATESFFRKYPDAKALEPKMLELARKLQPTPGVPVTEYFEHLYSLVKGGAGGAKAAREAVDRMVDSAAADAKPGGTPAKVVQGARPDRTKMTKAEFLKASMEAAEKGVRWER